MFSEQIELLQPMGILIFQEVIIKITSENKRLSFHLVYAVKYAFYRKDEACHLVQRE